MATLLTNQQLPNYYISPPTAIHDIVSSVSDVDINNSCIDFTEFLDILQDINIDYEEKDDQKSINNNNSYTKTKLNQYFNNLLTILQCNSHELNVSKLFQYIIQNYNHFKNYSAANKIELTAANYMKYLIDSSKINNNDQQSQISVESLMSIGEKMNEYLEDSDSIDFQEFIDFCTQFVSHTFSKTNLKFVYEFICSQQPNKQTEIRTAFFLRMIAKYATDSTTNNISDIIKSTLDRIMSNATNITIDNLQSHLKNEDEKQSGRIDLQQFKNGLKAAKVNCISANDMKKIFDLNATNNCMKIDTFIKRFNAVKSIVTNCNDLILNMYGNIVKRCDKAKRKGKKLERKYIQIFMNKEKEYKTVIQKQKNEIEELNVKLQQQQKIRMVDAKILKNMTRVSDIRLKRINDCENTIDKQRLEMKQMQQKMRETEKKLKESFNFDRMSKQRQLESELKLWKDRYINMQTKKDNLESQLKNKSKEIQFLKQNKQQKKVVKWQWQDNDKSFHMYPENISKQIEELEEKKSMQYTFKAPSHVYEISKQTKDTAFQTNIKTNVSRNVQRIEVTESKMDLSHFGYPDWWSVSSDCQYGLPKLVDLDLTHPMAQTIMNKFYETVNGYQVVKIESVENQMLYESYSNERRKLIKLNGEGLLNEKQLFHGTKQDIMKYIEIQGFRKEFNHRARFGEGSYFAKAANYSVNYSKQNGNGIYKMFLCYVLCGDMCVGQQSYKLTNWPLKNNGLLYDSLVDYVQDPRIVVIHENVRAYPMFVIHFR